MVDDGATNGLESVNGMSRIGWFAGALLLIASLAAAVVVARSPELNAAWQRVNDVCSQPLAAGRRLS